MGFPTRPSNVRVCQFHHSGTGGRRSHSRSRSPTVSNLAEPAEGNRYPLPSRPGTLAGGTHGPSRLNDLADPPALYGSCYTWPSGGRESGVTQLRVRGRTAGGGGLAAGRLRGPPAYRARAA